MGMGVNQLVKEPHTWTWRALGVSVSATQAPSLE